jgi:hypothetical protein
MKKLKFSWKGYFKPTPKLFRVVADGLLGLSGIVAAVGISQQLVWLPIICLVLGLGIKYSSNFFTEEKG